MSDVFYGLLGRKLPHSWSVPIHRLLGCEDYQLFEREQQELPAFLKDRRLGGVNVTIPYKRQVMALCDVIEETAAAVGCVNTIVRRGDGRLYAYNTDLEGFRYMVQQAGISMKNRKVLILGSGGASLTAQAVSAQLGAGRIVVISRSGPDNYENLQKHADGEIIVNTTPVGMFPCNGASPVNLEAFPSCVGVLDVVYNPRRTALLLQAQRLQLPCSDGLPMLVKQAMAAQELFFDKKLPEREAPRILSALRRETTNIVLIGMPGCGKSTVGAALAALTGREAIDLDRVIQDRIGMTIPEFFAQRGEAAFRILEREEAEAAGKLSGKLILTGGGIVKDPANYPALHQNGRIYHLRRRLEELATQGRPLSLGADLRAMWEERAPLYERFCDAVIDNHAAAADAAAAIWRDFCEHSGD